MSIIEPIDKRLDPFFAKYGKQWLLAVNYLGGVGIPLSLLATVLWGTQSLKNGAYAITMYFDLPFYLLVICALFGRYTKRLKRYNRRQTIAFIWLAIVLSAVVVSLSLPHMPLASHWHAPAPQTNIALLILVELVLVISLLIARYQQRRENYKKSSSAAFGGSSRRL